MKIKFKIQTLVITMGILSCLFSCKSEKKYTDKQGGDFIDKGEEQFIIPAEYKKSGKIYKIYLRNETNQIVNIKNKFSLQPNEHKILKFADTDSLMISNGTKIYFGETGLETEDNKGKLAGIGGEYWEKYNVAEDVEYGFVIVNAGEGDTAF